MHLLLVLIFVLICAYWYLTRTHNYWVKQNVPTMPGCVPGFGHVLPSLLMRETLKDLADRAYRGFADSSVVGFYFMRKPMIVLRDPNLVKHVLQSDFASFRNGCKINEKADPLMAKNPFFIYDLEAWRKSRARVVSHLSGKKLSHLFVIAQNVCAKMMDFIERRLGESRDAEYEVELKKLFVRYTGEMVANSAFGVEGQSFADERHPQSFHVVAESLFVPNFVNVVKQTIITFIPEAAAILNASMIPRSAEDFFRNMLLGILKHRKRQSQTSKPNDFLQFVLDTNTQDDVESIIADVIIYHADVYETSSSTLAFFMYQLSRHPEEQEKIRQHVRDATRTTGGGQLTYEALKAMNYLEQAVYELLRMIPPVPALLKRCVQNTTLVSQDGLECRLRPGDGVLIPVLGLQNDPKHWDEPEAFRPERFGPEQLAERHKYLFLAFGEGPRMCVGMRLGLMLVKLAAASLLLNYSIESSAKSKNPLEMDRTAFFAYAKDGVWARFRKLPL
ncbi:probable cytochrome P450 28d1 [Trichogramma pretiosum]|uniref:probable cytochrome P450 28d1 n=1 Tax=Trichogramma pretiosum TaxID=7493 RepID=UPI0006C99BF8|nr:probable cytochrome P450 28d1 [Trichogramma pretiosum]